MSRYHLMFLHEKIYNTSAHTRLVAAVQEMEPKPVYPDVEYVPAMIEMCQEEGSTKEAAEEVLAKYFSTSPDDRTLLFARI